MIAIQSSALAAQIEPVGRAVHCAPLPAMSTSLGGDQGAGRPTISFRIAQKSAAICATLRIATLQKNFNHHFENALTFNARQTPFNLVILVQFGHHAKPTLTHCGLAICEIYSDGSAFRLTQKTSTASHCPSTTSNARQAKRREKNPAFISGHFEGKTLGNQAKTVKNTPKKHVTIRQL
jgi:hypothetical protein